VTCRLREEAARLQKIGGEAEETSQAGTGNSHGLVGTVHGDAARGWAAAGWSSGDTNGTNWVTSRCGGRDDRSGGVSVHWGSGWSSASVADHRASSVDRLADGARAVSDGQGGRLGDSVGLAVEADLGGDRADGGQSRDDLCGIRHIASIRSRDSGGESQNRGDVELHVG